MCCSVLQCVAVCCSVLQCVVVCCSVFQCVALCRSVLQYVAVCCSMLQCLSVQNDTETNTLLAKYVDDPQLRCVCVHVHQIEVDFESDLGA